MFASHRQATVLCDNNLTCATPGHMVIFNDVPMMMKTYCQRVPTANCDHRIMLVNSPRMKAILRLTMDTPQLLLTAMAASYETAVEKIVMRVALSSGI